MKIAYCSIATVSYLRYASALVNSILETGDESQIFLLVPDLQAGDAIRQQIENSFPAQVTILSCDELRAQPDASAFWYFDPFELSNMLKPFLLFHCLGMDYDSAVYLDADLLFVSRLDEKLVELGWETVVFTPHHLSPPNDCSDIGEDALAQSGALNGGFYFFPNSKAANSILMWMMQVFPQHGFVDWGRGLFVDQKLIMNALAHFNEHIDVTHCAVLNIAYWNAYERKVTKISNRYLVGGDPVVFFHMSGFDPNDPTRICKYISNERNLEIERSAPWFRGVCDDYLMRFRCGFTGLDFPNRRYPFSKREGIEMTRRRRREFFETGTIKRFTFGRFLESSRLVLKKVLGK